MVANYHLTLITLERVVSIKAPVFYKTRLALDVFKFGWFKVSIIGTVAMFLISVLSIFSVEANDEFGLCRQELTQLATLINIVITTSVGTLVPFCIILVSNIYFSVALLSRRLQKSEVQPSTGGTQEDVAKTEKERKELKKAQIERNYVKMLFAMTSSFLVLNLATVALSAAAVFAQTRRQQVFMEAFVSYPLTFTHSINILFYFVSSPMFSNALEKALKKMFRCADKQNGASANPRQ